MVSAVGPWLVALAPAHGPRYSPPPRCRRCAGTTEGAQMAVKLRPWVGALVAVFAGAGMGLAQYAPPPAPPPPAKPPAQQLPPPGDFQPPPPVADLTPPEFA